MKDDEHICARCPKRLGTSCCEVGEDDHLATLTAADVERIRAHTGRRADRFCEEEWLPPEVAAEYEAHRPLYAGYFRRGSARLTLKRAGGACVFLDRASGCTLPADVRPTACRLYPFDLWPDGSWSLQVSRFGDLEDAAAAGGSACLAVELAASMDDVLRAFDVTREEIEAVGRQLRDEVIAHGSAAGGRRG